MSRVSYAMMHPEGAGEMTAAVRKALDGLVAALADAGRRSSAAEILELALVGNPIMHHLLLGIDPIAARRRRRSRWPPTGRSGRRPPSSGCAPTRARGSTSCRASPATSARTRRRDPGRGSRTAPSG